MPGIARRLVSVAGCAALAGGAGLLWAASRSRPAVPDLGSPDPPPGLPPGRVVAVPGHGEMFVRQAEGPAADAPVVLLLHGWMIAADLNWFTTYGPLAEDAHVLAVDHRGHGRGPRPAAPFRLTDAADDVAALLRVLDGPPVVAVGYSLGGPVAALLAHRHPDLVRGLVLCATAATFASTPLQRRSWRALGMLQVALRLLPRATFERLLRAQLEGRTRIRVSASLTADTGRNVGHLAAWAVSELRRGDPEDLADAGRELSRFDGTSWLPGLRLPVAVVVTARDRLVPPADQRRLARLIHGATLVEVDADHDAPAGRPEAFAAALRQALAAVTDAV